MIPLMRHNPGFLGEEDLRRSFVVRQKDLGLMLNTVRRNSGASNQHLLVVGPRGIGKTMLVRMAASEAARDPDLGQRWFPLVMSEETYEASTPGEFWLEALRRLHHATGQERWLKIYEELRAESDDRRLRDRALAQLMDFADARKKRILLVVENLQMLLEDQMDPDGAWDIRHTLLNEPRLMLLATATVELGALRDSDRAWYELLAVHRLLPLDNDECRILWKYITGEELVGDRIRPVRIVTGGNPRLVAIFAQFAAGKRLKQLLDDLVHLIDQSTEYFKGILDVLAPKERKAFVALLDIWDPAPARRVAENARIGVSEASAQLRRLASRGYVEQIGEGKSHLYQASERLFNLYYLMRREGQAQARFRAVARFIVTFYSVSRLVSCGAWDALDGPQEAVQQLPNILGGNEAPEQLMERATELAISAAAAGHGRQILEAIEASPARTELEPLLVGLRLFLGDKVLVAKEIMEVGRDVASRIRGVQQRLQSPVEPRVGGTGEEKEAS